MDPTYCCTLTPAVLLHTHTCHIAVHSHPPYCCTLTPAILLYTHTCHIAVHSHLPYCCTLTPAVLLYTHARHIAVHSHPQYCCTLTPAILLYTHTCLMQDFALNFDIFKENNFAVGKVQNVHFGLHTAAPGCSYCGSCS